jgi:hypothetical protein
MKKITILLFQEFPRMVTAEKDFNGIECKGFGMKKKKHYSNMTSKRG